MQKNKKIRIYCTIVCVFMSVHMQHTLKEVSLAALWTFIHHLCIPTSLLSVHGFFFFFQQNMVTTSFNLQLLMKNRCAVIICRV